MFQVIKRDGSKADFTLTKINDAIIKAFTATQMSYNNDIIDLLALRVTADFQKKVENDEIHDPGLQGRGQQLCQSRGLASEGELHGDLFRRWSDLKQFRCGNSELLAVRNLRRRDRRGTPQCGYPYP